MTNRYTKETLQALNNKLMTLDSGIWSTKTSFPGSNFTPPDNAPWLKVDYLFSKPVLIGAFSDAGTYREMGIYQVMVYVPKGNGMFEALDIVDKILGLFQRGSELTGSGPTVKIERSYRSSPMSEATWMKIPISVDFWWYVPYRS